MASPVRRPRPVRQTAGIAGIVALAVLASSGCSSDRARSPEPTVAGTNVTTTTVSAPSTTLTPPTTAPSPPPTEAPVAPPPRAGFAALQLRAAAAGVPGATEAVVVASACYGDENRSHWGYYNNGALGGPITEPDGAVVPLDAICLNPNQPDPYSSLVHELGHRYFFDRGIWDSIAAQMGSSERAAECFARHFGAVTYGQGGCSAADAERIGRILGL